LDFVQITQNRAMVNSTEISLEERENALSVVSKQTDLNSLPFILNAVKALLS